MDCGIILAAASPLLGLAGSVPVQVVAHWLMPRKPIVLSYAAGFLCGVFLSLVSLFAFRPSANGADVVICLLSFGGLNYCYSNFVNLNFTSLRIRLLKELRGSGGRESLERIASKYGSEAILKRRLARLVEWGQLEDENGSFTAKNGSFLALAHLFTVLKKLILGRAFRYETNA